MIKVWYARIIRSKTLWLSAVLSALGVLQASTDVFTPYIGAKGVGVLALVTGVLVAILRVVTTKSLADK